MVWRVGSFTVIYQLLTLIKAAHAITNVSVSTAVGTIIGFEDVVTVDGKTRPVTKFLGIPYAENMGGVNRFKKPIPKAAFQTPYSAMEFSASCFQTALRGQKMNLSEDCLFLNIYLPNKLKGSKSKPVMVWIHGGAFLYGSGKQYPAEALSVFGDVVVVTINYRLEMFGFLRSNNGALIGNQGLWDQQLAIQWVNKYIRSFGGNPEEVTIFGESAGSVSVLLQALYPGNKGLFKRVIAESGTALSNWAVSKPQGDELIDATACAGEKDPIICLRQKDPHDLEMKGVELRYAPAVDGEFLIQSPRDIINGNDSASEAARELFASLDILTGINNFDGALGLLNPPLPVQVEQLSDVTFNRSQFLKIIVPKIVNRTNPRCELARREITEAIVYQYTDWTDPNNDTKTRDMIVNLSCDTDFFSGAIGTVQSHSHFSRGKTYMYEFAVNPSYHILPTPSWITGANHADELPFVFGYPISDAYPTNVTFTDKEKIVSRAMITLWTNFAKSSDPNQPGDAKTYTKTLWPEYNNISQIYFQFSNVLGSQCLQQYFHPKRMEFWLEYIPNIMRISCPLGDSQ